MPQMSYMRMPDPSGLCDVAALLSQQRFLRKQELQVRGELMRLLKTQPLGVPQYRPLSPPPPQRPIERRINHGGSNDLGTANFRTDGSVEHVYYRHDSGIRKSLRNQSLELRQRGSVAAAVAERQHELRQRQQERQHHILREQQSLQRPPYYRASDVAYGLAQSQEASPYTFDTGRVQDGFRRFSGPNRGETSPLDYRHVLRGDPWVQMRQKKRLSPRHLPAAGMPSGNNNWVCEERIENHQRRSMFSSHAAGSALSALQFSNHRPPLGGQESGLRQHGMNQEAHGHAESLARPAGGALPSTSPPALHPEPGDLDPFYYKQRHVGRGSAGILPGESPSQYDCRQATAALCDPPFCVWSSKIQPAFVQEYQPNQHLKRQEFGQSRRRQPCVTTDLPAGMPSGYNDRASWGFRGSLRAPSEPRAGRIKPTSVAGRSRITSGVSPKANGATTGAFLSDDEETLRNLGIDMSPRELLFFKKQPNLQIKQQRVRTRSRQSTKPAGMAKELHSGLLMRSATVEGHEFTRDLASKEAWSDGIDMRQPTAAWSLPSWMRAYGISDSSAAKRVVSSTSAVGFPENLPPVPILNREAYFSASGANWQSTPPCGCRCCRLRQAARTGINSKDKPCCCCACCVGRGGPSVGMPDPSGDFGSEGQKPNVASGIRRAVSAGKSRCSRCGQWTQVSSFSGVPEQQEAQPSVKQKGLTLEEAATLCEACATYLVCQRRGSAPETISHSGNGGVLSDTDNMVKPTKVKLSPTRHRAVASDSRDSSPTEGSPPRDQDSSLREHSPAAFAPENPRRSTNVVSFRSTQEFSLRSGGHQQASHAADVTRNNPPLLKGLAHRRHSSADAKKNSKRQAPISESSHPVVSSRGKPASNTLWESPRIVAKICLFLSLSKLLLVRRCNKTFLQAAQFRMRYILYKSLYVMLNQPTASNGEHPVMVEGYHCPISAVALIKLLGLDPVEVQAVKEGNLPPAYPDEAATPRMEDVAFAIRRERATQHVAKESTRKQSPGRPVAACREQSIKGKKASSSDSETKQRLLLDAHMTKQQAREEACLKESLYVEQQLTKPAALGYDEAAGPTAPRYSEPTQSVTSREPATFRRVRHSFLKLWNYDDAALRQALVRATSAPYPTWLFDVAALLLRAVFQVCCNSLSAPPLKDLIPLFAPEGRQSANTEMPCRADSYLWAKMARISGYAMHLVLDSTWPPLREAVVRLVAQPFGNSEAFITETFQNAPLRGGGVVPLVLRPDVVDSLELKMSKVPPEFITEFVLYGKQQQLLHSSDHHLLLRDGVRQVKVSSELMLLMDLYEWLAAVLTHNQRVDVGGMARIMPSVCSVPVCHKTRHPATKPGTLPSKLHVAKQLREPLRPPQGLQTRRSTAGASVECSRWTTSAERSLRGPIGSADAKALCALIEEQGVILREVCRLLRSVKTHRSSVTG